MEEEKKEERRKKKNGGKNWDKEEIQSFFYLLLSDGRYCCRVPSRACWRSVIWSVKNSKQR